MAETEILGISKLGKQGKITLAKKARDILKLKAGDVIVEERIDDKIVIRKG